MIPMFFTKPVLNTPQLFTFFGNGNWLLGCLLLFASMIKVIYLFMYDPSTYITACAAMIQGHDQSLVRSKYGHPWLHLIFRGHGPWHSNKQRTKKDQHFLTQKFIVPLTTEDLMIRHKFVTSLDLHVDF